MKIMTKRLLLRPFTEQDAKDWYYITQDNAAYRYLPYICPVTIYKAISDIKEIYSKCDFQNNFFFIIDERELKKPIGAIFATKALNSQIYEISFLIGKDFRRNGYMEEALKSFIKKLPEGKTLIFEFDTNNYATEKLIKKIPSAELVLLGKDRIVYSLTK